MVICLCVVYVNAFVYDPIILGIGVGFKPLVPQGTTRLFYVLYLYDISYPAQLGQPTFQCGQVKCLLDYCEATK